MPRQIAAVIQAGKATLIECQTVLSIGDVYLLLEVAAVEAHNKRAIEEDIAAREKR